MAEPLLGLGNAGCDGAAAGIGLSRGAGLDGGAGIDGATGADGAEQLDELRERAAACTACELPVDATQPVFGAAGPVPRSCSWVSSRATRRTVRGSRSSGSPAGCSTGVAEAGVGRADASVTNAVKHFRVRREGGRRIHRTPGVEHVRACLPWLRAELAGVRP